MKALLTLTLTAALSLGLSSSLFAAEVKPKAAAEETKKAAKPVDPDKEIPMYVRVDEVDAGAKTFSMKRKDGVLLKHVVPATAELKNGEKALKFDEIKTGDWVGGLRKQKSPTDYEVVKITKIGTAPAKRGKAKDDEAKAGEKKQ